MTNEEFSRRSFFTKLAATYGAASILGGPIFGGTPEGAPRMADENFPGNSYRLLGYKRLIIDYHFSEFNSRALTEASAQEIVDAVEKLGVSSLLLYSKDHWGNIYHKSSFSKRHRNVPQDLFGEVLDGVKKDGVKVEAYTTVCWDEDSARKHPDWVMLNGERQPIRLNDGKVFAKWTWLCLNSPYRDYFLRQMDELIGNYEFDGLFLDIVLNHRALVCYNPCCLRKWKELYGSEMPYPMSDSQYARYLEFNTMTFESVFEQIKDIGRRHNKQFLMTHNFGLTYKYDDYLASEFDTHGADFYLPSIRAKMFRARAGGREVELIGHRFNRQWDFTLKPEALMKFEVATAISHNCAMVYVDQPYLDGSLDPQVYEALKSAFVAADELAPKIRNTVPHAEIGLLSSERSFELDYSTYRDFSGAYAMLSQLHWPFDVLTERDLTKQRLETLAVLVVPNIIHLGPSHASEVREYLESGGRVIFCYRSATKDPSGNDLERPSFGVVRITGDSANQVSFVRPKWKLTNRYLRTSDVSLFETTVPGDVLATITDPALRVTDTEWISHNAMPGDETKVPAIFVGKLGKGSFIYFGFRLFDDYVEQGQPALRDAFEIGFRSLYEPRIWVETAGNIEAVFQRTLKSMRIALINGITSKVMTGDMWAGERGQRGGVSIPEVVPVHDVAVKIKGMMVRRATNLRGAELPVLRSGSVTSVMLPVLEHYDLVELILEGES
jgi:Hypothetical glycosyl hydrolase 6/Beta-galactosidase trimerisation domain